MSAFKTCKECGQVLGKACCARNAAIVVAKLKRKIRHKSLRYKKGGICDACSEDFVWNSALDKVLEIIYEKTSS